MGLTENVLQLFFEASDDGNVLTTKAIRDMFRVREVVESVETDYKGLRRKLPDLCWKNTDGTLQMLVSSITRRDNAPRCLHASYLRHPTAARN
jgi:hypothetical protein